MAEYIERNMTIAMLRERGLEATEKIGPVFSNGIFDAVRFLNEQPISDVAPVVHGRWKYYKKQGIAVCTVCSFERKLDDNFGRAVCCPNCGAKMDKEG